MRVGIVIPIYNEEAIIEHSIRTILKYTLELPYKVTLIAVNDGSKDMTSEILELLQTQYTQSVFHAISYTPNRGYGGAQRAGIAYVVEQGFDYVIFMDSDLTNHPKYLAQFCAKMGEGWDYIKASRYVEGGVVDGVPLYKQLISRIGNIAGRILFDIAVRDVTNGFRAVRSSLFAKMRLEEDGFALILEELSEAKRLGARFCEIPYTLTSRSGDVGRSKFGYTLHTCRKYLKHAIRSRSK
ncbi:MAG: glycosyltransferase family 2 protein [Candidatus Uhrbacteria bacterium]